MDKQTMRRTVRFKDREIECFKSDFYYQNSNNINKSKKEKITPFEVDRNTILKGLKLIEYRKTGAKFFLLHYWFKGKSKTLRIGKFIPKVFGTKQVEEKLFKIVKSHQDDKGYWIRDPFLTDKEKQRVVSKEQHMESKKKTINEMIEEFSKAGFPRAKQDGNLVSSSLREKAKYLFGYNHRFKHFKCFDKDGKSFVVFVPNHKKRTKKPKDWGDLFKKFPPGKGVIPGKRITHSLYDSILGKTIIDDLTSGDIARYISGLKYGSKKGIIESISLIWHFAKDNGFLGDSPGSNPRKMITLKKPKVSENKFSIYNKRIFNKDAQRLIYRACDKIRFDFPFQTECIMFMQITSARRTEALKIQKKYIKWDEGIIELPGSITKSGKDRFIAITSKLKVVLDKIMEIKKRPGYEWVNFVPWLFPTPRFRTEDFYDNRLGQEYIQSDLTRLKNIRCAWIKIMKVTGIKIGAPKMLRKAYSTTAKDILGATGPATQLTGHEEDSTLDRFYYGADRQTVKNNAEKVAEYFDFIKETN